MNGKSFFIKNFLFAFFKGKSKTTLCKVMTTTFPLKNLLQKLTFFEMNLF